jgi:hypothetical protein
MKNMNNQSMPGASRRYGNRDLLSFNAKTLPLGLLIAAIVN